MRRRLRITGLLLWRGGLLLAGGWAGFESLRYFLRAFDLPAQMEFGVGLALTGVGFVLASMLLERFEDSRNEGDLRQ